MKKYLGTFSLAALITLTAVSPAFALAESGSRADVDAEVGELRTMMQTGQGSTTVRVKGPNGEVEVRGTMMRPPEAGMMVPAILGIVTAVNGNTLTVNGKLGFGRNAAATTTYSVNATNARVIKNNATSSISAITVGDTVAVQGKVTGTTVVASVIRDGVMIGGKGPFGNEKDKNGQDALAGLSGNGQPIVAGTVTSVGSTTITVTNKSNVTYTVDATTAKIIQGKNTVTGSLVNVKVGDNVVVQGAVNGTSITASTIIDQSMSASAASTTRPGKGNEDKKPGFFGGIGQFFMHMFGF